MQPYNYGLTKIRFGPVPATILTETKILVPVPDIFKISVPAGNSVKNFKIHIGKFRPQIRFKMFKNRYYKTLFSIISLLSF